MVKRPLATLLIVLLATRSISAADDPAEARSPFTALELLRLAQQVDPADATTALALASTAAEIGLTREALAVCEQIVEEHPLNVTALVLLGNLRLERGDERAAAVAFELAYELGSPAAELAETIGELRARSGALVDAARWYERALASMESVSATKKTAGLRARVELLRGRASAERGDLEAARASWTRALELGVVDSLELASYFAARAFRSKDFARALRYYDRVAELRPGDPDALYFRVRCLIELERRDDATTALARYIEHHGLDERADGLVGALAGA